MKFAVSLTVTSYDSSCIRGKLFFVEALNKDEALGKACRLQEQKFPQKLYQQYQPLVLSCDTEVTE